MDHSSNDAESRRSSSPSLTPPITSSTSSVENSPPQRSRARTMSRVDFLRRVSHSFRVPNGNAAQDPVAQLETQALPMEPVRHFKPESEFSRNMTAACRTTLAAFFALGWGAWVSPYHHSLNFFAGVIAIVGSLGTAGETLVAVFGIIHGMFFACFLAAIMHLTIGFHSWVTGIGIFICSFLILRRKRLTPIGKKLACVTLLIATLVFRHQVGFGPWSHYVWAWMRSSIVGAISAVLATLVPTPKLALSEAIHRAQYLCQCMESATTVCVEGCIAGRDERRINRVGLVLEQMNLNINRIKELRPSCRIELMVIFWGQAGGEGPTEILDALVQNMGPRVTCIDVMRRALEQLDHGVEQSAFMEHLAQHLAATSAVIKEVMQLTEWNLTLRSLFGWNKVTVFGGELRERKEDHNFSTALHPTLDKLGRRTEALLDRYQVARVAILYGIDPTSKDTRSDIPIGREVPVEHLRQFKEAADLSYKGTHKLQLEEDEIILDAMPPPPFDIKVHDAVVNEWDHHGYRQAFARGTFFFNFVTLVMLMAKLAQMEGAIIRHTQRTAWQRFRRACYLVLMDMWLATSPIPPVQHGWAKFKAIRSGAHSMSEEGHRDREDKQRMSTKTYYTRNMLRFLEKHRTDVVHPLKIALILTVCSFFSLSDTLNASFNPGVWVSFTAAFIVSEDSSSAVVTGNLRLVGSVLGALYAWWVTKLIVGNAGTTAMDHSMALLSLLPWIFVCSFFRFSRSHGYAAVVSAFTAVVILLGTFNTATQGMTAPLGRIENTILGLIIYMVLDTLIWPIRAKRMLEVALTKSFGIMHSEVRLMEEALGGVLTAIDEESSFSPTRSISDGMQRKMGFSSAALESPHLKESDYTNYSPTSNNNNSDWSPPWKSRLADIRAWDWRGGSFLKRKPTDEITQEAMIPVQLGDLTKVSESLMSQAKWIELSSLEPTLWHSPFHRPSYDAVFAAEKDVLSALILLKRAQFAFEKLCTEHMWASEIKHLPGVMQGLKKMLKLATYTLQDAEEVFNRARIPLGEGKLDANLNKVTKAQRVQQAHRILLLQVEARRLFKIIDREMVDYMKGDGTSKPALSLHFGLRLTTTAFSVMRLKRALVTLGYAIMALLERESCIFYYT